MRFLDANLSPIVAARLRSSGHEAAHVVDVGLGTALDTEIIDHAEETGAVVVTADTDFPTLMALHRAASPSIVLLRHVNELSPEEHARLLISNLSTVTEDLEHGAVVSLGPNHLRVRSLPIT